MKKKQTPGIGSNGALPEHSDIRAALATEVLFTEKAAILREQHKRAKKGWGEKGIKVEDIKQLYALKDLNEAEVEAEFRRRLHTIGAVFSNMTSQYDLFAPKPSAPAKQAAFRHLGMMAGIEGKPAIAPPTAVGDDLNQWLEGHAEGADSREAASNEVADIMAKALDNGAKGIVTDGTGKEPDVAETGAKAAKTRAKAKADAKADNPEPPPADPATAQDYDQPDWKNFSDDPVEWFAEQSRAFAAWFDGLPMSANVRISHPGVLKAFRARRGESPTAPVATDGAEAPAAEPEESQSQRAERLRNEAGI